MGCSGEPQLPPRAHDVPWDAPSEDRTRQCHRLGL